MMNLTTDKITTRKQLTPYLKKRVRLLHSIWKTETVLTQFFLYADRRVIPGNEEVVKSLLDSYQTTINQIHKLEELVDSLGGNENDFLFGFHPRLTIPKVRLNDMFKS